MPTESLSTINKVLSIVLQEERQQNYKVNGHLDVEAEKRDALTN